MEEELIVLLPKNRLKTIFHEKILRKCCKEMLLLYLAVQEKNYNRNISWENIILN